LAQSISRLPYPRRVAMRHSHTREDVAGCLVPQLCPLNYG
jgi:hypothetical protein